MQAVREGPYRPAQAGTGQDIVTLTQAARPDHRQPPTSACHPVGTFHTKDAVYACARVMLVTMTRPGGRERGPGMPGARVRGAWSELWGPANFFRGSRSSGRGRPRRR
ncbi:hypothetical protein Sm713_32040 [Streptomyces sp. TS71-3]|nr:hypothetical protein Sm713_32040 [Streptomyces sp. TS71-3]